MKYTSAILALAATVIAQSGSGPGGSVTEDVAPDTQASGDCKSDFPFGPTFTFNTMNITGPGSKRDLESRATNVACGGEGSLILTLNGGKLLDSKGRTGYIASNRQFQFDGPPQAGAIYTAGWSVCESNKHLSLGGNDTFYNCLSGTFNNIYDQSQGNQCYPVYIVTIPCTASSSIPIASKPATVSIASSATSENIMTEMMTSAAATSAPATSAPAATVVKGTAPAGTASGAPSNTASGPTSSPSPFVGAGAIVEAGQKIVGLVAGVAAFALL
ncbi:uncharacterized protein KY384_002944 [Bacidia gigantensis]|uniref:uncharacterized protein n=1 Tax=Bacidia gigantensis TaxID=2732470 RepID=UPI001D03B941|nr:uncharacterized protein KY384_002944 [Bacidia gigantensis]KAG8531315.1 hypothetical protein KY384_002944 [Bacidia gigantensis]